MAWACSKFDQFIRGLQFTIETDHKPSVRLMSLTDLDQVPARILRFRLRLMRYAPVVTHVQGAQNHLADALCRAPSSQPTALDMVLIEEVEADARAFLTSDPLLEEIPFMSRNSKKYSEQMECIQD